MITSSRRNSPEAAEGVHLPAASESGIVDQGRHSFDAAHMDPFSGFTWTHTDEDANAALLAVLNQYGSQDPSLWSSTLPAHLPPSLPFDWNFDQHSQSDDPPLLSNTLFASSPDAAVNPSRPSDASFQPPPLRSPSAGSTAVSQPLVLPHEVEAMQPTSSSSTSRKRKLRPHVRGSQACQGCRKARMRCTAAADQPCERCQRKGVPCSFGQPIALSAGASAPAIAMRTPSSIDSSSAGGVKQNIRALLNKEDILLLHSIYMRRFNPDLPILQEDLHSPQFLSRTS